MSIHLSRIYTRGGDKGQTSLIGGERVPKSHPRLEAYGTVDELNCLLGKWRSLASAASGTPEQIQQIAQTQMPQLQNDLFDLGTLLATPTGQEWKGMPVLRHEAAQRLETWIDAMNAELPELTSFVLPGGHPLNAEAHLARAVCRRLERLMAHMPEYGVAVHADYLSFINRLSDYLFVLSRYCSLHTGTPEYLWQPNRENT